MKNHFLKISLRLLVYWSLYSNVFCFCCFFFITLTFLNYASFYSLLVFFFLHFILGSNNMVTLKATDCAGWRQMFWEHSDRYIYIFSNFKNFYSFTIMILKYSRTDTQAYSFIWLFIRTLTIAKAAITKYHYWYVVWWSWLILTYLSAMLATFISSKKYHGRYKLITHDFHCLCKVLPRKPNCVHTPLE